MKGEITTSQIFWIIVFLITLVVFIGAAMWLKGYGVNVIHMLPGFLPGLSFAGGSAGKNLAERWRAKGLSVTMNTIWLLMLLLLIIMVLAVFRTIGLI
ncbi:MAG: hypothetical protein ACP5E4_00250 [Candidatus Aenigmatarchaeota archaeon]